MVGLGGEHERRRRWLRPPAGEPCPFCALPMWPGQDLHADHVVPRVLGGEDGPLRWAHAFCNMRAGGRLGRSRQLERERHEDPPPSREW